LNPLNAAVVVAGKELRLFFRDRVGLALGFLLPIALVGVFGFVMQIAFGGGDGVPRVALWVADVDDTAASRTMIAELRKVAMLSVRPRADDDPVDAETARSKVLDGDVTHALILQPGFGAALESGEEPEMVLVRDPDRNMEDQLVRLGVMQAFMAATEGRLWPATFARQLRGMGMSEDGAARVRDLAEGMRGAIGGYLGSTGDGGTGGDPENGGFDMQSLTSGMVPLIEEDQAPPDRPKELTYMLAQSISGVSVMMLLFGMMALASTLLQEREEGTLQRLLASGMPRDALLWGKALAGILVGVLQLVILLGFGSALFRVDLFADPVSLAVMVVTWAAASVAFGLVIATWARTRKQAEGLSTLLILLMAALGGCWFPVQLAGDVHWTFDVITHATITWWAMSGFQDLFWRGASWTDPSVLTAVGVLLGFTAAALLVARTLYRRRFVRAVG